MRNKEMMQRIKTAGEYQKKAIRALFPEEIGGHLDVIEKELRAIVMEAAAGLLKENHKVDACKEEQSREQASKVRKVNIV